MKSSKSVGDLMSEIQKETDAMMLVAGARGVGHNAKEEGVHKSRKYSQTPPPSKAQATITDRPV